MSQPRNQQLAAEAKRTRDGQAVASEGERFVRQRTAPSADAAVAASPASSRTVLRLSLMRLAVVERQLIMQGLDISSLARLASTCKQMRGEALHKEAGKFISILTYPRSLIAKNDAAHASELFRMHAPVRLIIDTGWHTCSSTSEMEGGPLTLPNQQELIAKASTFARITDLIICGDAWTETHALQLLSQPWIQSVRSVDVSSRLWLRSPSIQHALFVLPHLTSARLRKGFNTLIESAVALASKLSTVSIDLAFPTAQDVRAIRVAPALTSLELTLFDLEKPLRPFIWCVPSTLTSLRLFGFSLNPESTPRSAVKTMFSRLPKLQTLHTSLMEIGPMMQGMLDVGPAALPDLRRVQFDTDAIDEMQLNDLMRRFMRKFKSVAVRFGYAFDTPTEHSNEYAERVARWLGQVEAEVTHPSDDEPESEVELEEEPASSEEQL